MASVTKTITETAGEVQQTTTYYFNSFEDFMEYERVMNNGSTAPVSIVVDEPRVELEVGKQYRITKQLYGHGFDIGTVVVVVSNLDQDGDYGAKLTDGSGYWYIKPDEVEEI